MSIKRHLVLLSLCAAIILPAFGQYSCSGAYIDSVALVEVSFSYATKVFNAAFSVSSTKKVIFAGGNLQYNPARNRWRFAEHQYDVIGCGPKSGNAVGTYSSGATPMVAGKTRTDRASMDKWIDLFQWGTSGYNNTAYADRHDTTNYKLTSSDSTNYDIEKLYVYQPWNYEERGYDLPYPYKDSTINLYKGSLIDSSFVRPTDASVISATARESDWAWHNAITNGGCLSPDDDPSTIICHDGVHQWYVPTSKEMKYVLVDRTNACELVALATIMIKDSAHHGLLLLPDAWEWHIPGPGEALLAPWETKWYPSFSKRGKCGGNSDAKIEGLAWTDNVLTEEEWEVFEEFGAVFLPAAGGMQFGRWTWSNGSGTVNEFAEYWTSSLKDGTTCNTLRFDAGGVYDKKPNGSFCVPASRSPLFSLSIRPVRNYDD